MINEPNIRLMQTTHVHYNPKLNQMVSVQWRQDLEVYEVHRYSDLGRLSLSLMSMERIVEDSRGERWEFIGVL